MYHGARQRGTSKTRSHHHQKVAHVNSCPASHKPHTLPYTHRHSRSTGLQSRPPFFAGAVPVFPERLRLEWMSLLSASSSPPPPPPRTCSRSRWLSHTLEPRLPSPVLQILPRAAPACPTRPRPAVPANAMRATAPHSYPSLPPSLPPSVSSQSHAESRGRHAQGHCQQVQVEGPAASAMVLPNVREAMPGREWIQVPHHVREPFAADAGLCREPYAGTCFLSPPSLPPSLPPSSSVCDIHSLPSLLSS